MRQASICIWIHSNPFWALAAGVPKGPPLLRFAMPLRRIPGRGTGQFDRNALALITICQVIPSKQLPEGSLHHQIEDLRRIDFIGAFSIEAICSDDFVERLLTRSKQLDR